MANYPVVLIKVTDSSEHLTVGHRLYGGEDRGPLPALQVVFPDAHSRWQWDARSGFAKMAILGPVPDALS